MNIDCPLKTSVLFALHFLFLLDCSTAQEQRMTLDHLGKLVRVSSPQVSPDGNTVVAVVSRPNYEENRHENQLVQIDISSGRARELTFDRPKVGRPRWSPKGDHLAFMALDNSGDDPLMQVFVLPSEGGESRAVTSAPLGVVSFEWSADGSSIFYVAADKPAEPVEGPERHNKSFVVGHHDYLASKRPAPCHLWKIPISGGEPQRINDDQVVVEAVGEFPCMQVAPDGSAVAFRGFPSNRPGDYHKSGLYVIDLNTMKRRNFEGGLQGAIWGAVAPNGKNVAYSWAQDGNFYRSQSIMIADALGGPGKRITPLIDRSCWGATWMPDSSGLLIGAHDSAQSSLWFQPIAGEPRKLDLGNLNVSFRFGPADLDVSESGGVALIASGPQRPSELYWMESLGGTPKRLTHYNASVEELDLGSVEEITWDGPDGFHENGVLIYPPDFDPNQKYPLVLRIHGGPMAATTTRFDDLGQLLAARGFVVFGPNYRGSDNLGAKYQEAVIHDAGKGPGKDVMAGLEAVKKLGFVDEDRIGVSGWSYGGYMTTWLIGNYPEVWRAAMAGAPVTDYVDSYSLSDYNTAFGSGFNKPPWSREGQAEWRAQSPIAYAHKATTPTLILCNTGDLRVPITQSYKLYRALDDHDVPVQFVAYPLPGHFPVDPVHQRDVLKRWCDWMEDRFQVPRDQPVSDAR